MNIAIREGLTDAVTRSGAALVAPLVTFKTPQIGFRERVVTRRLGNGTTRATHGDTEDPESPWQVRLR